MSKSQLHVKLKGTAAQCVEGHADIDRAIRHFNARVRRADRWNDIAAYLLALSIGVNIFQLWN